MIRNSMVVFLLLGFAGLAIGQTPRLDIPKDCLCIGVPRPACELAGRPEVVAIFLGKVSAMNRLPWGNADTVQFQVEEVFRGSLGPTTGVQVHTHHCAPFTIVDPFEEGEEYVVYATKKRSNDELQMGSDAVVNLYEESGDDSGLSCTSKAVEVKYSAEDLAYWRSFSRAPETGRIFGTVKEHIRQVLIDDPSEERSYEMKPLVGQEVIVQSSDHSYTTKTDDLGRYEFQSIPPGKYEVFSSDAEQTIFPTRVTADVAAKGCAQVEFRRDWDSFSRNIDSARKRKASDDQSNSK